MDVNEDYYGVEELLSDEQVLLIASARNWVTMHVEPIIEQCAEEHSCPVHLYPMMGEMGFLGPTTSQHWGGAGLDDISYGLMMQELERGGSSIRSMASVQGSLVMYPIERFGSDEQKEKFLPRLASGEMIGCFGLTEADHGSDPQSMLTTIKKKGQDYVLTGSKMWITNSPIADIAVVWAKDDHGIVRGVIVEKGMAGFSAPEIVGKWSLRASITGELVFDEVIIPHENMLPEVKGMKGPLSCLSKARYGIAWGAIGAALDCYCTAIEYAMQRKQFGRPIGQFQLTQKKLAEMITEITKAQLLAWRLGTLMNQDKATPAQISLAKRNNVEMALQVARTSRQILGAMGISNSYPIMRHMMNLETVLTYEGTHDIHLLITGLDVTGLNAFKS